MEPWLNVREISSARDILPYTVVYFYVLPLLMRLKLGQLK